MTNVDAKLVSDIVERLKKQGLFDQFRKECLSTVDSKVEYQNLSYGVEENVQRFLAKQTWRPDLNKNHLREGLRRHLQESQALSEDIDWVVNQVLDEKIVHDFKPKIDKVVCEYVGVDYDDWISAKNRRSENYSNIHGAKVPSLLDLDVQPPWSSHGIDNSHPGTNVLGIPMPIPGDPASIGVFPSSVTSFGLRGLEQNTKEMQEENLPSQVTPRHTTGDPQSTMSEAASQVVSPLGKTSKSEMPNESNWPGKDLIDQHAVDNTHEKRKTRSQDQPLTNAKSLGDVILRTISAKSTRSSNTDDRNASASSQQKPTANTEATIDEHSGLLSRFVSDDSNNATEDSDSAMSLDKTNDTSDDDDDDDDHLTLDGHSEISKDLSEHRQKTESVPIEVAQEHDTAEPPKKYHFAWESVHVDDLSISSVHTSDLSSFEESDVEEGGSEQGGRSVAVSDTEVNHDDHQPRKPSKGNIDTAVVNEMVNRIRSADTVPVSSAMHASPAKQPMANVPEVNIKKAKKRGNDRDDNEEETREERKARMALEKEERYLRRQERRAELETTKKTTANARAANKAQQVAASDVNPAMKTNTKSVKASSSSVSVSELSTEPPSKLTSTSSKLKGASRQAITKQRLKEDLMEKKVLEKQRELRRRRTVNPKYLSEDFTSMFTEKDIENEKEGEAQEVSLVTERNADDGEVLFDEDSQVEQSVEIEQSIEIDASGNFMDYSEGLILEENVDDSVTEAEENGMQEDVICQYEEGSNTTYNSDIIYHGEMDRMEAVYCSTDMQTTDAVYCVIAAEDGSDAVYVEAVDSHEGTYTEMVYYVADAENASDETSRYELVQDENMVAQSVVLVEDGTGLVQECSEDAQSTVYNSDEPVSTVSLSSNNPNHSDIVHTADEPLFPENQPRSLLKHDEQPSRSTHEFQEQLSFSNLQPLTFSSDNSQPPLLPEHRGDSSPSGVEEHRLADYDHEKEQKSSLKDNPISTMDQANLATIQPICEEQSSSLQFSSSCDDKAIVAVPNGSDTELKLSNISSQCDPLDSTGQVGTIGEEATVQEATTLKNNKVVAMQPSLAAEVKRITRSRLSRGGSSRSSSSSDSQLPQSAHTGTDTAESLPSYTFELALSDQLSENKLSLIHQQSNEDNQEQTTRSTRSLRRTSALDSSSTSEAVTQSFQTKAAVGSMRRRSGAREDESSGTPALDAKPGDSSDSHSLSTGRTRSSQKRTDVDNAPIARRLRH